MAQTERSEEESFPITDSIVNSIVADAFATLGNETRLEILLTLWEASDEVDGLSFSDLHEMVGVRDSGQFNYHLNRLVGSFVRRKDDSYHLRHAGAAIIEAVIAGMGFEDPMLAPTVIDIECPFCGAATAVGYEDELLYQVCTECDGSWRDPDANAVENEAVEEKGYGGRLFATTFDPAGLTGRTPREMFETAVLKAVLELVLSMNGICPACSGPRENSLYVCEEHTPGPNEVCPRCRSQWGISPRFVCRACKSMTIPGPSSVVCFHPGVINFYNDHGITVGNVTEPASIWRYFTLAGSHEVELAAEDPPLVRVRIRHGDEELSLTYDETIDVVDVSRKTS